MSFSFKQKIIRNLFNIPGWQTNRKLVIIESDDWGSIRMPSKEIYLKCLKAGYRVDLNPYERYDSLESERDLTLLFDLLISFIDKNGNHPTITSNCVVANPDFAMIEKNDFKNYYFELVTETFQKYEQHKNCFNLWKSGINNGVFFPQYHAREHVNVSLFMKSLKEGDRDALFGFNNGMPGSIALSELRKGNNFVEATRYSSAADKLEKLGIYLQGLEIFEQLLGYRSESIIPTNYIWSQDFNHAVKLKGVRYIQGIRKMQEPRPNTNSKYHTRFTGQKNEHQQINIVRNCTFEPSLVSKGNEVDNCLNEMEISFRWKKPAIISCHRINFIGHIDPSNREKNLSLLRQLLTKSLKKWPDIEFINSVQLGHIIETSYNENSNPSHKWDFQ